MSSWKLKVIALHFNTRAFMLAFLHSKNIQLYPSAGVGIRLSPMKAGVKN